MKKTKWYYVVYRDYPGGKPYLSSKHLAQDDALIAMRRKLKDSYWRGYTWEITTEKPI